MNSPFEIGRYWRSSFGGLLSIWAVLGCQPAETEPDGSIANSSAENTDVALGEPILPGELNISEPLDGSRIVGDVLLFRGTSTALSSLQVGESEINLEPDGSWMAEIAPDPGLRVVEVVATTLLGPLIQRDRLVLFGNGRIASEPVSEGVILRLSAAQVGELGVELAGNVDSEEMESSMKEAGPLHRSSLGPANFRILLDRLEFEEARLAIEPRDGEFGLEVLLDDLEIDANIEIRLGIGRIGHIADLSMEADPAIIHSTMVPEIRDGEIRVDCRDTEVRFEEFEFEVSGLPPGIEPDSVRQMIQRALEGQIEEQLEEQIASELNELLEEINQEITVPVFDETIRIRPNPSRIDIDQNGVDLAFSPSIRHGEHAGESTPVLVRNHPVPANRNVTDAAIMVADDLANTALHQLWEAGIFEVALDSDEEWFDASILEALGSQTATVRIHPRLPPVLVDHGNSAQIQAGPIDVHIVSPDGRFGENLHIEVSTWIDIEARIQDNRVELTQTNTETRTRIIETDWSIPEPIIMASLTRMMDLETRIDDLLEDLELEIPETPFPSLRISSVDRVPTGGYTRGQFSFD